MAFVNFTYCREHRRRAEARGEFERLKGAGLSLNEGVNCKLLLVACGSGANRGNNIMSELLSYVG